LNARERYYNTIHFLPTDRFTYNFGGPRQSTLDAWEFQGLKRDSNWQQLVGADAYSGLPISPGPDPAFEERTLRIEGDKRIWIDNLGATRIDEVHPTTPGFVTRRWLRFPVQTRADYAEMKKRFVVDSPGRIPADFEQRRRQLDPATRESILSLTIRGPFWMVRDWVGFENLCTLCADDPSWVKEMFDFTCDFAIANLTERIEGMELDHLFVNEDMAYKHASMISPQMVRELMFPGYRRLLDFLRDAGVRSIIMDCDGHIGQLMPLWIEAGFHGTWPCEIAALNDPVEYRKEYGTDIALLGGIDKRELRFGFEEVKAEVMGKVPFLMAQGGFVPGVDHGTPPDVPVRNYLYMVELIKALAEGRDVDKVNIGRYQEVLGPIRENWSMDLSRRILHDSLEEDGDET
jgi:uroporphyrinogen-III decarboxylase